MATLSTILTEMDNNHKAAMERAEKNLQENKAKAERTYLFIAEALGEGLKLDVPSYGYEAYNPTFQLAKDKPDDWRVVHKLVGELESAGTQPHGDDARKRMVKVLLKPKDEAFKHLTFTYIRKLEKAEKSKCKLVRVKSSYLTMVCED